MNKIGIGVVVLLVVAACSSTSAETTTTADGGRNDDDGRWSNNDEFCYAGDNNDDRCASNRWSCRLCHWFVGVGRCELHGSDLRESRRFRGTE